MKRIIDFHRGWMYGFPKVLPDNVDNIEQWAIEQGLPEEFASLPYRTWKTSDMYSLTKIFIEEGKSSMIQVGDSIRGSLFRVTEYATPNEPIEADGIRIGDQILVGRGPNDWISTSRIKRIEKVSDVSWTIWTQTSVYKLEIDTLTEIPKPKEH